ncbi:MAG: hypothetical protein ACFFCV_07600 [Promethearchaeota archaeon]
MMIPNLQESEAFFKKTQNTCRVKSSPCAYDCQDCRYRHKGLCDIFIDYNSENPINDNSINLDNKIEVLADLRLEDLEPVLDLKDLFYEVKINNGIRNTIENFPQKTKYDSFKLLTDIQRVLKKCKHLTQKDKLMYCQSQRYFMKLYLREINKPD